MCRIPRRRYPYRLHLSKAISYAIHTCQASPQLAYNLTLVRETVRVYKTVTFLKMLGDEEEGRI